MYDIAGWFDMQSSGDAMIDMPVVPIIDLGLNTETGAWPLLGVVRDAPWGNLKFCDKCDEEQTYEDTTMTLIAWCQQIILDWRQYQRPPARSLTVGDTWAPLGNTADINVHALPVQTAIAVFRPYAKKRRRVRLELYVQVEPDVWAHGVFPGVRQSEDEEHSLVAMCALAAADIERQIMRDRSQWVLTTSDVASKVNAVTATVYKEYYRGRITIQDRT